MNRSVNMSKTNDPKSGEKTIKDKEGKGHVRKDDAMNVNEKSAEEVRVDDSNCEISNCVALDSPNFNEKSPTAKDKPGIRVFHCSSSVPRTYMRSMTGQYGTGCGTGYGTGYGIGYTTNMDENNRCAKQVILECPTPRDSPRYNMNLPKRGKCVIFNHEYFDPGNGNPRMGTRLDVQAIEKTFGALGFEITIYTDLVWYEVNEEIGKLSQEDYKDCACICIFILTHGDASGRLSARDASYPFISIWRPFTADNCPTLFGKPKIFFTQACRGSYYDEPIRGKSETDYNDQSYTLPSQADFLFGYSTVDGFYSVREVKEGSWYIQTLCDVINKHWEDHDLVKMLTITARKVGMEKSVRTIPHLKERKQMPTISSTLTRDIYFAPQP